MKVKITKNSIIIFSFILMCLSVFFLRWYINSNLVGYVATISSTVLLLFFRKPQKASLNKILSLIIFIIYVLINILLTNEHSNLFEDLIQRTIIPFMILIFFTIFFNSNFIYEKIKNYIFYIFNCYYIVNTLIILKQIEVKGFMVRNFSNNTLYVDQIDGFFGTNGTHRLCMFFLICLYMNLLNFNSKNKYTKKIAKVMFWIVLITSIYVSAYNNNRMYYLLLIVFIFPILYKLSKKKIEIKISKKKIIQILILLFSIISISVIAYKCNEKFRTFIIEEIYENNIKRTIDSTNKTTSATNEQGEERLDLTIYALEYGNGYFIGKGIGSIALYGDPRLPQHFGLCETTTRIYTGGIFYLLLIAYIYTSFICNYIKNKNKTIYIYIYMTILIFSLYARIFTLFDETFLISIIYLYLAKYIDNLNYNNKVQEI